VKHNRLICVEPIKSRYIGETGHVVVGRITQVANKRWKVDVDAAQEAVLQLSAVELPGGEHRIRSEEDQLHMREMYDVGDLLNVRANQAEVQSLSQDGKVIALQTRTAKFGRLRNGLLVKVPHQQVRAIQIGRFRHHLVSLSCGVDLVIGRNGLIWVYTNLPQEVTVDLSRRRMIVRVGNCLKLLHKANHSISPDSIEAALKVTQHIELE
jgi:exosome complex component RRP4